MRLTKPQQQALHNLWQRSPLRTQGTSYLAFRREVFGMIGEPDTIIVRFCGMIVGIEPDGYTHS
jgi:hypothetical protein